MIKNLLAITGATVIGWVVYNMVKKYWYEDWLAHDKYERQMY